MTAGLYRRWLDIKRENNGAYVIVGRAAIFISARREASNDAPA